MTIIRIAVVGHPDSGKSTLSSQLNQYAPRKILANESRHFQAIELNDEPPLHLSDQYDFVVVTWDLSVTLSEGEAYRHHVESLIQSLAEGPCSLTRACVVGTKRDRVSTDALASADMALSRARDLALRWPILKMFPVNALDGSGISELTNHIVTCVFPGVQRASRIQSLMIYVNQIRAWALDSLAAAFALPVPPNVNKPTPDPQALDDSAIDTLLNSPESRAWDAALEKYARGVFSGVTVHKITPSLVVKDLCRTEFATMLYVRSHTRIPVPEPRYPHLTRWLAMDLVKGKMLLECWDTLSYWMQFRVACTLRGYIRQLRNLPNGTRPGPIDGDGSIQDHYLFDQQDCGPFPSSTVFRTWCEWVAHLAWVRTVHTRRLMGVIPDVPDPYPIMGGEWSLSLIHGDLNLGNIMLSEDGVLWLVDWGAAGYYPEWLETYGIRYSQAPASFERWRSFIAGSYPAYESFWGFFLQEANVAPRMTCR